VLYAKWEMIAQKRKNENKIVKRTSSLGGRGGREKNFIGLWTGVGEICGEFVNCSLILILKTSVQVM
jgi:hypothetical protein